MAMPVCSRGIPLAIPGHTEIDFSHHLSVLANSRKVSPLKDLQKYMYDAPKDIISLSAGLPDPAYFPFTSISGEAPAPNLFIRKKPSLFSWLRRKISKGVYERTGRVTIPKHAACEGGIDLATTLQYGPTTGLQPFHDFLRQFTEKVFKPACSDWTILANVGNTNGLHRAFVMLCNPGECILMEEWTYFLAMAAAQPLGILPASVKMDGQGMCSADLERVLSGWDEDARGAKRPHVLYLVPVGQNPTGATMSAERKRAIYDICVRYDVIIIEDDPYYFFQEGTYALKANRKGSSYTEVKYDETHFFSSLVPSFVRFDYQGRVIRLDTFSKVLAPGVRVGWFTCNSFFADHFEQEGETTTQMPSGFSQALITQLLSKHWGFSNFLRWLRGLQVQYTLRRDFFVDCIFDEFDVRPNSDLDLCLLFGATTHVYTAYMKSRGVQEKPPLVKTPLFSFVPPSSGMFVWLRFHLRDHVEMSLANSNDGLTIGEKMWIDFVKNGLLVTPGWVFSASSQATESEKMSATLHEPTFRLSYSYGSFDNIRSGIQILAKVMKQYLKA